MYNAGDVLLIQSEMANDNREIWLYPVFVPIEDIPVEVTQITFHGNGYNSQTEMETNGNVTVYKDNSEDPTIVGQTSISAVRVLCLKGGPLAQRRLHHG